MVPGKAASMIFEVSAAGSFDREETELLKALNDVAVARYIITFVCVPYD